MSDTQGHSVQRQGSEENEQFEQSLHMPMEKCMTSQSGSLKPDPLTRGGHDSAVSWQDEKTNLPGQRLRPVGASQTQVDCDEHEYEYADTPRARSQSESSDMDHGSRPVAYHNTHGLSHQSDHINIYETMPDNQPFTYHKPPFPRFDRDQSKDRPALAVSKSHTSLSRNHSSPSRGCQEPSPVHIRRWESEHCNLRDITMVPTGMDFPHEDWHRG